MKRHWMPLYVNDYLGDTRRLKTVEHGAYLLLIMEYWQRGGLPCDDSELADITGLEIDEWMAMRPRIARLFQDGWKHKRIDAEIAKAEQVSERRSANAKRRWSAREASANQEVCKSNAIALQETCTRGRTTTTTTITDNREIVDNPIGGLVASQAAPRKASRAKPRSQIAEDAKPTEADAKSAIAAGLSGERFISEWRKFRDHHRAKGSLMADWQAAWRTWLGNLGKFSNARAGPARGGGVGELLAKCYGLNDGDRDEKKGDPKNVLLLPVAGDTGRDAGGGDGGGVSRNPALDLIGSSFRRM